MENLPEWAKADSEAKIVYVQTAPQALSIAGVIPEDWGVVIEDGADSRKMVKLLRELGLR